MKTNKELYAELQILTKAAEEALDAAEKFADENKLTFRFAPAYGMGGTYYPAVAEYKSDYSETTEENYAFVKRGESGWMPSSHGC